MLFTVNCCGQFGGKLVLEEWTVSNQTEQAFNNYLSTSEWTIIYFIKMKYKNSLSLALCLSMEAGLPQLLPTSDFVFSRACISLTVLVL